MTLSIQGYTDPLAMGYPICNAPEKNLASLGVPYSNSIMESSIGINPSRVPYIGVSVISPRREKQFLDLR